MRETSQPFPWKEQPWPTVLSSPNVITVDIITEGLDLWSKNLWPLRRANDIAFLGLMTKRYLPNPRKNLVDKMCRSLLSLSMNVDSLKNEKRKETIACVSLSNSLPSSRTGKEDNRLSKDPDECRQGSTFVDDENATNNLLYWTLRETVSSDVGCPFYVLAPTHSLRHQIVTRLLLPALQSTQLVSEAAVFTLQHSPTEEYKRQEMVQTMATTPLSQYFLLPQLLQREDTDMAVVMDAKTQSFQGIEQFMTFYRVRRLYPIFLAEDVDASFLSPAHDGCVLVTGHLTPHMRYSLRNFGLSETKCDCIARSVETGWYYAFISRKNTGQSKHELQKKTWSPFSPSPLSYTENGIILLILPLPAEVRCEISL